MVQIRDMFEELCQTIDIRNPQGTEYEITMEDFITKNGGGATALATVAIWTRAMLGVEPADVSALYFLDYCKSGGGLMQMRSDRKDGGQYLRIRKGTQSFSKCIAADMTPGSVVLNMPVTRISQDAAGATVTTADGKVFTCKKVIVSVPTPLYKEITFTPALSGHKRLLTSSTKLGFYSKMIILYARPFWKDQGLCGMSQSFSSPVPVTRDTSVESEGHYSLTCFCTGGVGLDWGKLTAYERQKKVVDYVTEIFGTPEASKPLEVVEQIWANEQWSQGAPCPVMAPGMMTELGHALREPFGSVHFVGTETSYEWKGYMEGAVRSGERGAGEVVAALQKEDAPMSSKL